ncbi:MAG: four helix bundle protein [Bacteroidota bacterium]|nr:four helix bundle protein [Bacteroidota bacterium]
MKQRKSNRGYMKLDVWQIVKDLKIDFKPRAQIIDAAQSVSSNIAEGYSRRSINEYMQHPQVSNESKYFLQRYL